MTTAQLSETAKQDILELAVQQMELYRRQGAEIISHFNHEDSAQKGYRDRQLLELLQNADDAGADPEGCKLLLHLTRERLVAANTGKPFSKKGITSLVISDCSPKQLEQNRFIGQKGLGFRSVLTWTDRPLIVSGDYELLFDRQQAIAIVRQLADELSAVQESVDEFHTSTGRWPAAVMRFPLVPQEDDGWLTTAREYRAQGYDTVVVLPLPAGERGDEVHEEIGAQLLSLSTSSLLFCRHLTQVIIEGDVAGSWMLDRTNGTVIVAHDGVPETWQVYRKPGQVSTEVAENSGGERRDYEIAVAVPVLPEQNPDGKLCVFFPTRVHLPCPVVMHATLETTDDRNRLVSSTSNREVLEALAVHVADVLVREATPEAPRRALELLAGIEQADPDLQGFRDQLIAACKKQSLFPRLDRNIQPSGQVRRVPNSVWLATINAEEFPEVLPINREDPLNPLLALFDLEWFDKTTLKERLGAFLARLSPGTAGEVLGRLLAYDQLSAVGADGLLLGSDSRLVSGKCFFPPTERLPVLPSWASTVRFVHSDFQDGVLRGTRVGGLRYLIGRLNHIGADVDEYGFDTVARALIKQVPEGLADDSSEIIARWQELLLWIYSASAGSPQALPTLPLSVITTQGTLRRATTCYLGRDYSGGQLLWRLYQGFGQDEFVGSPAANGLGGLSLSDAEAFLCRIGINDIPRTVMLDSGTDYQLFREHVIDRLEFPLSLRGERFADAQELRWRATCDINKLKLPDRFMELLTQGDAAALAAYLLSAGAPLLTTEYDAQAKLQTRVGLERNPRDEDAVPIPNPVLFFLREKPWVPTLEGACKTTKIMLSIAGAKVLRNVYSRHTIDHKDQHIAAYGGREALESLLTRLGAVSSLENLGGQSLYELLLALPDSDPQGKVAPGIYRTLMESSVSVEESTYRARFVRDGRMWGHYQGNDEYLPVTQLRYNANVTIPKAIESHIPLVDIPRAKSTFLVKELFGIQSLGSDEISVTVLPENTEYDDGSEDANQRLHTAIPYIYALRLGSGLDAGGRDLNLLRKAALRVCTRAQIAARLPDGTTREITFAEPGERIATDTALVMIGAYQPDGISALSFWLGVAELVAEFLGRDIAGEVGGILRCNTPAEMAEVVRVRLGPLAEAKLADAKSRLADWIDDEEESEKEIPAPKPTVSAHDGSSPEPTTPRPTPQPEATDEGSPEQSTRTEPKFQPITGPSTRPGKRRELVVVGGSSGSCKMRGPIATETVTFRVVEAFEQHDGPRYIIPVSHLHGSNAFGCDLLSVGSQEIKEQALQQGSINTSDILRYIEVKGRSNRTTEIELEDNEFRAAEQHREKYWIYRVYRDPDQDDHYEVALLCDPINSDAVRILTRFNMGQGSGSTWYSMIDEIVDEQPSVGQDAIPEPEHEEGN